MDDPDIVILRHSIHGRDREEYAALLRERLPDREVQLARTPDEERDLLEDATVATAHTMDEDLLERAERLQLFACVYAGVGHLPLSAFEERGVAVTSASGVHGPNIAEYAIGSLLTFSRGFHRAWQRQQRREYRSFQTRELKDSTVTVVGLGAIGEAVVDRLEPFDVETVGVRYTPEKGGPSDEVVGFGAIHDALARTDYLVLACPLTETTEGLIDREALSTLPAEAVVVNVARGEIVDTDDLVFALQRNGIRGAALDVTDPEPLPADHDLWTFSNVLLTPHNAGDTPHYYERVADILSENLRRLEADPGADLRNHVV
ncbi:MAG: D-2-hydroxyacid dehydrogenase [Haloarculaceae archaeon]